MCKTEKQRISDYAIEEVWRDVPGWEDLYQVSSLGCVRSKDRLVRVNVFGKREGIRIIRGRAIKSILHNGWTHHPEYMVSLSREGKSVKMYVHRLVAMAFIPNPNNLPCINHKDENSLNNVVTNLEWCDSSYNNAYGTRVERVAKSNRKNRRCKPVIQYTVQGEYIREWSSVNEIERELGFSEGSISYCCKFNGNQSHGYKWRYK